MSADVESRLYRAGSWLKRAEDASEHLDGQFIFSWIALNALYGQRPTENATPNDRGDRNAFLRRIAGCEATRASALTEALRSVKADAASLLESEFLYEEYWTMGYTDELVTVIDRGTRKLQSWPARNVARGLIDLFDRLATLRNQVVHGSSKDGSGANRHSVEAAVRVLMRLVPAFCSVLRSHIDQDWGPLPFPAKGRPGHPENLRTT